MKLNKQVCSLEFAKRLKSLNVKQDSLFYWFNMGGGFFLQYFDKLAEYADENEMEGTKKDWAKNYMKKYGDDNNFSAFTVAELGELLPAGYLTKKVSSGREWKCYYSDHAGNKLQEATTCENEADCRAKMLEYLIENNLLEP